MTYLSKVIRHLQELETSNTKELGRRITERLINGGIIQLFGCGHSSLLAQEPYYRAGGLVPVKPIIIEPLMLHEGPVRSSAYEKTSHYVENYLEDVDLRKEDTLIIISTSGRNPAPIDTALWGKKKGAYVLGILSKAYSISQPSRHLSGKRLEDVVDDVIDTNIPVGDAILEEGSTGQPFAPASSVAGIALLQNLLAEVVTCYKEFGEEPPIFWSGNLDGVEEHNKRLIEKFEHRINFE
ncbi:sugar isomerase domain-containing protein [Halobacillus massiliensis]|uniref:sugar isomerase domain-containing protein n=1 Tax=Halobacillus massiliensis TaxID=1926286 RepID=UPI0009E4EAC9|nr:SIS domain-containing protein [Halobacillus massiliensis]